MLLTGGKFFCGTFNDSLCAEILEQREMLASDNWKQLPKK
jgi:hypothetical protein